MNGETPKAAAVEELTAADAIEKTYIDFERFPFVIDPLETLRPNAPNPRTDENVWVPSTTGSLPEVTELKWTQADFAKLDAGRLPMGKTSEFLNRAVNALKGLSESCAATVRNEGIELAEKDQVFFEVLDRDARDSLAAIPMVLAQTEISSQLVDNLNASIHLRALLTDLFHVDEVLKTQRQSADLAVFPTGR